VVASVGVGDGHPQELENGLSFIFKESQFFHDGLPIVTKLNYSRQKLLLLIFS
jgi:hypothetical protein